MRIGLLGTKIVLHAKSIIYLFSKDKVETTKTLKEPYLIYPRTNERALAPADVPANIAKILMRRH